ncbi:MAG: sigma-70 family RNA polymerase sigma factor [Verrucomicrobiae bacterium]|nr:sigma-70 family RNA polymerase sigma factor [Verrucomicrobiae bacterium]
MMTTTMTADAANLDAELVVASLSGDREAFGQIVTRYQSLICSLAYSATGSLGTSEDLAQETFITAWKHLRHLRERRKLRAWLCGIARNLINRSLHREGREPLCSAEPLEAVTESASDEALPHDQMISKEEEAILWRSLERIPESYRVPLVLFYRGHNSIESVAAALELSEDAVKQRLSRGRKLLAEEVAAFVEGALARTNPGKAFTVGVLAALPLAVATSAKAAALGATVAKGSALAKGTTTSGLLAAILGPALIFCGSYIGYRVSVEVTRSEVEREIIRSYYRRIGICVAAIFAAYAAPTFWLCHQANDYALLANLWLCGSMVIYFVTLFGFTLGSFRKQRQSCSRLLDSEYAGQFPEPAFEYRSRLAPLGLPLVHIRIGDRFEVLKGPVKAWFAVGNVAIGGLFAFGGIVVAPLSIGFCALGLMPFGAISLGLIALGASAAGVWAFGAVAVGWQAFGEWAVGWNAAAGGVALAHDFALGRIARAAQVNRDIVWEFMKGNPFFHYARQLVNYSAWLNLLWVIPLVVQWRIMAGKRRREQPVKSLRSL